MIARSSLRCLAGGSRGRNLAALVAMAFGAITQVGCKDRLYEAGQTVSLIDGAAADAPTDAGGAGGRTDARPGTGGRLDAGGGTGGAGGGTDAGPQGTGGMLP